MREQPATWVDGSGTPWLFVANSQRAFGSHAGPRWLERASLSANWTKNEFDDLADRRQRRALQLQLVLGRHMPHRARSGDRRCALDKRARLGPALAESNPRRRRALRDRQQLQALGVRARRAAAHAHRHADCRPERQHRARHAADRQRRRHDQLHGHARRALPHRRRHRLRRLARWRHVYDRPDHRGLHGQRDVRDHHAHGHARRPATAARAPSNRTRRRRSTTATRRPSRSRRCRRT